MRHLTAVELFTLQQARAAGWSRRAIAAALDNGEIWRVLQSVYAYADVPDGVETRARAVAMLRPADTVVCRTSAAWMSGLDVLPPGRSIHDLPLDLLVPSKKRAPRIRGCNGREGALPASDVTTVHGVPTTVDQRTALDCARFLPRLQAIAAVDAFLNRGRVCLADLHERAAELKAQRKVRLLRANLADADAGAQSPGESVHRVRPIDGGLPRPQTQIPVRDGAGRLIGYLDMGYTDFLVGSEYDGEEHHTSPKNREHDDARRGDMRGCGWAISVARKGDIYRDHPLLVATVAEDLLSRGWEPENPLVLETISANAEWHRRRQERG